MLLEDIVAAVRAAHDGHAPLRLRGAGSKDFYGGLLAGEVLDLSAHQGIVAYEPTELYITARCGTPLSEIEAVLAEEGQMLAFEPPHFSGATLGGAIAAGLSGPRRQQAGAVRDFVLGVKLVDGTGQVLDFGGQVMKNVAGYDVSRFIAGSLGTLGVIAEATLKVLPRPVAEATLEFVCTEAEAIRLLNTWGGQPLPVSASFWHADRLWLRLSGAEAAVAAACHKLSGRVVADAGHGWAAVREQTHAAYAGPTLWRLALPSTTPPLALDGLRAIEWGGGLRW
ncbi:MAG: glycolate oxidase subunit GlcE, partial [Dechloromonas sp.]